MNNPAAELRGILLIKEWQNIKIVIYPMSKIPEIFFSICVFISILPFSACKYYEKANIKTENKQKEKTFDQSSSGNASNEAKIIATVIEIDESRDSSDINSPCYKAPCLANIRIEKIERKGNLFHTPESNEITAFFIYTLHPTNEDLFPNFGKWHPGLKINDKFEAIIESRPTINEGRRFIIYDYKKLE